MRIAAVLTDLDGTLLEPDGSATAEAVAALAWLAAAGVPVIAVTSKTPAELAELTRGLVLSGVAGFENGAGVMLPDGSVRLEPAAVPLGELAALARVLAAATGAALRTLLDLDDGELAAYTGLSGNALAAARARRATLPLLVERRWDDALRRALPAAPAVRLVRGNRFLHLQGNHDKADVVPRLLALAKHGAGAVVALGDSPNDAGMLAAADVAVIVPGHDGPHPELQRVTAARLAPEPHGRGWARAVRAIAGEM